MCTFHGSAAHSITINPASRPTARPTPPEQRWQLCLSVASLSPTVPTRIFHAHITQALQGFAARLTAAASTRSLNFSVPIHRRGRHRGAVAIADKANERRVAHTETRPLLPCPQLRRSPRSLLSPNPNRRRRRSHGSRPPCWPHLLTRFRRGRTIVAKSSTSTTHTGSSHPLASIRWRRPNSFAVASFFVASTFLRAGSRRAAPRWRAALLHGHVVSSLSFSCSSPR